MTPASDGAIPSTPRPSITARVRTCSASTARCSVSYCSATIRVNIASVIAMNGTGYGTSNNGNPACAAAAISVFGVALVVEPQPEAAAREPRPGRGACT